MNLENVMDISEVKTMKTMLMLLIAGLAMGACTKKPDAPPPAAAATTTTTSNEPPSPPPVTSCKGSTVPWSSTPGDTIHDNSSKQFTIPGFDLGCGDSVRVYMRRPGIFPADPWTEYFNVDNGASYYALSGQVVTVYNKTGIILEVDIEAILK